MRGTLASTCYWVLLLQISTLGQRRKSFHYQYMDLSSVRNSTGLFNWDLETGDLVEVDASGVDYAKVSREMGWLSGRASGSQFGLRLLAAFISLMLEEHVKTSQKSHSAKEDADMAVPESEAEDEDVKEAI